MKLYSRIGHADYYWKIEVPTTIFENLEVRISIYNDKDNELITENFCELKKLPKWDIPSQSIQLCKLDEKRVYRRAKSLIKMVENNNK